MKIQTPKSRQKSDHAAQGRALLDSIADRPHCGSCDHYEPDNEAGGICYGVEPVALMKLDGSVVGAFPPVKVHWRCPNWRQGFLQKPPKD